MVFDLSPFESIEIENYADAAILSETDYRLINLFEYYEDLSTDLKQVFRKEFSERLGRLLLVFAERIASYLLNEYDQKLFRLGLHSLDACMEIIGTHDVFAALSLFYDVYKRHILLFEDFLNSEEPIGKALKVYLLKDEEAKSIGAMGYVFEHNALGQAFYKKKQDFPRA